MIRLNRKTRYTGQSYASTPGKNNSSKPGLGVSHKLSEKAAKSQHSSNEFTMQAAAPSMIGTPYNNTYISTLPINVDLNTLLDDIGHDYFSIRAERVLYRLYRDMYFFDCIAGSAVDMVSSLPFSEFSLGGIQNKDVSKKFNKILERLNIRTLLPELSTDYLVLGAFIGSLLYDKTHKTFSDLMPHAIENCDITPLPFYSQAPIIEVKFTQALVDLLSNTESPRIRALREKFGHELISKITSGKLELDPLSTVYIPRRSFSHTEGTSYFKRILPIYLLEKNLFRGTLLESSRRQKGIGHLIVGDGDTWEPNESDLSYITELFTGAAGDPLGAIVATRLGVSVEEVMCLRNQTLIDTSQGLVRIDEIVPHDPEEFNGERHAVPVDIEVKGLNGDFVKADIWFYQGYKPVYRVKTDRGSIVDCTENHRFLVLDENTGDLIKVKAKHLLENNMSIACDTKGFCTNSMLPLDLEDDTDLLKFDESLIKPDYMTAELAFMMGLIVADGNVDYRHVYVGSTCVELLEEFVRCMDVVFNKHCKIVLAKSQGQNDFSFSSVDRGDRKLDLYRVRASGLQLASYFKQLGMVLSNEASAEGSRACYECVVPWSILQADRQSKLAFISGYLCGDGYIIAKKDTSICAVEIGAVSYSSNLIYGLKCLFGDLGYDCLNSEADEGRRLYLKPAEASMFYNEIYPYIAHPDKKPYDVCDGVKSQKSGIPSQFVVKLIKDRFIRHGGTKGVWYKDDDGRPVLLNKVVKAFLNQIYRNGPFSYQAYDNGSYDKALDLLKQISLSTYNKLIRLFELRLRFEKVVSYEYIGEDHVYDLSIKQPDFPTIFKNGKAYRQKPESTGKKYQPTFYAVNGGILTSNSPDNTWKVMDVWDQTTQMKFKALGINESLLSGEATFNTMDNSLTLFIDHLLSYRNMITRKLFYNVLFPLVSVINGYSMSESGKLTIGESLLKENVEDTLAMIQDGSKLLVPTVHWAKSLKPEGDSQYFDILDRLTQAGVPIPLRVIAAAGGFNIHDLLAQKDDDIANRQQVGEYLKELTDIRNKFAPPQEGQEQGGGGFSGFSSSSNNENENDLFRVLGANNNTRSTVLSEHGARPSLDSRFENVNPEVVGRTRTGKPKYLPNQKQIQDKANANIVKSLRNLRKNGASYFEATSKTDLVD